MNIFQDDDTGISYHGVVYIETAPLLYPGGKSKNKSQHEINFAFIATRLRGAYKVVPYNETEYKAKVMEQEILFYFIITCFSQQTKRAGNVIDEAMKIANQLFDRSSLTATKKDAKLTVDKQAAATAASVPKKVIKMIFLLTLESGKIFITCLRQNNSLRKYDTIRHVFHSSKKFQKSSSECYGINI